MSVFPVKSSSLKARMHCHFPRFLLEKIIDAYFLTMSCCTTATVIVSYCAENNNIKSATSNKKALMQVVTEPPVGPTERKSPVTNTKAPLQIEIRRHVIRKIKKNKHLHQLPVKVAFGEDADGVPDQRLRLFGSRVNKRFIIRSTQNDHTGYFSRKETTKQVMFPYIQEVSKT